MREHIFWQVRSQTQTVALTFDDGPDVNITPRILDLLAQYGAYATFFVLGEKALHHPNLIRRPRRPLLSRINRLGGLGWRNVQHNS